MFPALPGRNVLSQVSGEAEQRPRFTNYAGLPASRLDLSAEQKKLNKEKKMKKFAITATVLLAVACVLALTGSVTRAGGGKTTTLFTPLNGWEEPPALVTPAFGTFSATVSEDESSVDYELTYEGIPTRVTAAHIHIGLPGFNGGVTVFLCGGGGQPDCPAKAGTVTSTFTAADVRALPANRLAAGDLASLLDGIRKGATYANVHTMDLPGGEIRGQIRVVDAGAEK